MNSPNNTTRRDFLLDATKATAAASVATYLPATAVGEERNRSPNERISLGVIGIGPRCTYDLTAMLKFADVRCIAIADVQASRRTSGKAFVDGHYGNKDCEVYRDFRELLDRKDIDAVLIATGDRWHAAASIMAAEAGKDVYSEKPCGITIDLCQQLADTMHREKRVFQAGTQRRSVPNFQKAVELVTAANSGSSTRCTLRSTFRCWKTVGYRPSRCRRTMLSIGTLAGLRTLASVQPAVCQRPLARSVGF